MFDTIEYGPNGVQASGSVAARLMQGGMKVTSLRSATVLRKDEWELFDETVIETARIRLGAFNDLIQRGLVFNIENALGTTRIEWETVSDMEAAEIDMAAVTEGQRDRVEYNLVGVPLPIFHKSFRLNIRALEASRNVGQPLDQTQASIATKKVAELMETTLFDGATLVSGSSSITGYTNAANRNTGSIVDWSLVGTTGAVIVTSVLAMMLANRTDHYYGPYILYVPIDYWNKLQEDYKADSDRTILERILAIEGVEGVRSTEQLTGGGSGEVLLISMERDVVDFVDGQQPTPIEWDEMGGLVKHFKVMAIMVPRMKSDFTGQSGIAHYSV